MLAPVNNRDLIERRLRYSSVSIFSSQAHEKKSMGNSLEIIRTLSKDLFVGLENLFQLQSRVIVHFSVKVLVVGHGR